MRRIWVAPDTKDWYAPGVSEPVESMRVFITQIGFVRIDVNTPFARRLVDLLAPS